MKKMIVVLVSSLFFLLSGVVSAQSDKENGEEVYEYVLKKYSCYMDTSETEIQKWIFYLKEDGSDILTIKRSFSKPIKQWSVYRNGKIIDGEQYYIDVVFKLGKRKEIIKGTASEVGGSWTRYTVYLTE